jgi:uncharacterized protein YutD
MRHPKAMPLALVCLLQISNYIKKYCLFGFLLFLAKHIPNLQDSTGFSLRKRSSHDGRREKKQHPLPFPPPMLGASRC